MSWGLMPTAARIGCEQAEFGTEDGTAAAVHENETIGDVQDERVHRDRWRHGPVGGAMHGQQLVFRRAGDVVEEVDALAEGAVIERGDQDVAA